MSYVFEGLEPASVLKYFYELSQIPRMPGDQKRVSDWAASVGRSLGYETCQDGRQNVIIYKPASPGMEDALPVAVQSHLDMVCEKEPGVAHDFAKDPLELRMVGNNKVMATGTTLGADNGVGVAFIMTLLADKTLKHPPIEAVFTTDEETDMGGAFGLAYDKISSKLLINLDAGAVCVCGSGELEVEMKPQQTWTAVYDARRGLAVIAPGQLESAVRDLTERPIALTLFRGTRRTVLTDGEPGGQQRCADRREDL
jgi:dipeptidase D